MPKLVTAALAVLLLSPCACSRHEAAARDLVPAAAPGVLAQPMPADLPPPPPASDPQPEAPPSADEVAAFHAPVPK